MFLIFILVLVVILAIASFAVLPLYPKECYDVGPSDKCNTILGPGNLADYLDDSGCVDLDNFRSCCTTVECGGAGGYYYVPMNRTVS